MATILDLTAQHDGAARKRNRPWSDVTGITLHQTACILSEKPTRWYSLHAHLGVTASGLIFLVNPIETVVYHGNGFNSHDVGIEINGMFEGIEGDPKTFWSHPDPGRHDGPAPQPTLPTAAQIEASREAVRYVVDEVASHGGKVRFIHAHRSSSADRRSDPGSRLWQEVGIWARDTLGLTDGGPGFAIGDGRPIPAEWDPARTGIRY